jgi:16S rRNA G1207 methylase RsmC
MTDPIGTLIKEVAIKHGITVSRDDPILILQTLNAHLMDENTRAQQVMLHQYKEELEAIALRWGHDAKEKSERILNASLAASKEVMFNALEGSAKTTARTIRDEIEGLLSDADRSVRRSRVVAMMNLGASVLTCIAVGMLSFGLLR